LPDVRRVRKPDHVRLPYETIACACSLTHDASQAGPSGRINIDTSYAGDAAYHSGNTTPDGPYASSSSFSSVNSASPSLRKPEAAFVRNVPLTRLPNLT
jgi:hypothetical protein